MARKKVKYMPREQQKAVMAKLNPPIHVREHQRKYPKTYEKSYYELIPKKINFVEMKKFIEAHPEDAKQTLANIALWTGCLVAPEACPIIKSVYYLYKSRKTVYKISDGDIRYDEGLFRMMFQKQIDEETIKNIFPPTVNILARKAEYALSILDELSNFRISNDEYNKIEKSLLSVIFKMEDKVFLTNNELNEKSLKITEFFNIDEKKLLNAFVETLRKNDMSLYASLLKHIVEL